MIYPHNETTKSTIVRCECWNEEINIIRTDWSSETGYYISFKADCFTTGQDVFATIKKRIKFAWQALRKGSYIHEEIVVTRKSLQELKADIEELLKEPDVQ